MAINQAYCSSFKKQLLEGVHDFRTALAGGDIFKIALYTEAANLNSTTDTYTTTGEVVGTGYTAGGATLSQVTPSVYNQSGILTFDTIAWPASTISARAALIYNTTPPHTYSNPSCVVLDFGIVRSSLGNTFSVTFPASTDQTAIIRIF